MKTGGGEPGRPSGAGSRPGDFGRLARQIGAYAGLALTLPAAGLVGYAIGSALDAHWRTGSIFTVIFLFLGCAAGLLEIVRVVARKP